MLDSHHLTQRIPSFPNCDNYSLYGNSGPDTASYDSKLDDRLLHQEMCIQFEIDYKNEMFAIQETKHRSQKKISTTLLALLPNEVIETSEGPTVVG